MTVIFSHKIRRHGHWNFVRFQQEIATSNFVCSNDRPAPGLDDRRQDDYDIWLGTDTLDGCIPWARHGTTSNVLYLDGHAQSVLRTEALPAPYPGGLILTQDGIYPR